MREIALEATSEFAKLLFRQAVGVAQDDVRAGLATDDEARGLKLRERFARLVRAPLRADASAEVGYWSKPEDHLKDSRGEAALPDHSVISDPLRSNSVLVVKEGLW